MIRKFLQLFILITLSFPVHGQQRTNWNDAYKKYKTGNKSTKVISPYSITIRGGLTQFYGELHQQDMQGVVGLGLGRSLNKTFSLGLDYSIGTLGGQETSFFNAYFINKYSTVEFLGKWNLTQQFVPNHDGEFTINMYGGIGLMMFSANAYDIATNNLLRFTNSKTSERNKLFRRWGRPHGKPGIRKTNERVIPVGISADYQLFEKLLFGVDYRFYFVRSDKADATSGMRLINPEEAESYSKTPNDKFSFLSFSVTYRFSGYPKH